jgi:hypothetical protein
MIFNIYQIQYTKLPYRNPPAWAIVSSIDGEKAELNLKQFFELESEFSGLRVLKIRDTKAKSNLEGVLYPVRE